MERWSPLIGVLLTLGVAAPLLAIALWDPRGVGLVVIVVTWLLIGAAAITYDLRHAR